MIHMQWKAMPIRDTSSVTWGAICIEISLDWRLSEIPKQLRWSGMQLVSLMGMVSHFYTTNVVHSLWNMIYKLYRTSYTKLKIQHLLYGRHIPEGSKSQILHYCRNIGDMENSHPFIIMRG